MLEKIVRLENVGLFQAGVSRALALNKVTLFYADNARGKSTFSSVLRACSTADSDPLSARATIGAKGTPRVQLRFALPGGAKNVSFDAGKWNDSVPHLQVFDQTFVEQNVYAGSEVNPDHHQALLDFAIGSAAIAKKKEVNDIGVAQVAATRARTTAEDKLRGYRGQTGIDAFIALAKDANPDSRIAELELRAANAKAAAVLNARAELRPIGVFQLELNSFDSVLQSTFEQVHENAQALVTAHLATHGGQSAERWLATGLAFHTEDSCPFCGQGTSGLDLIAAYKTYFNNEYAAHMNRVAGLASTAQDFLPEAKVAALEAEQRANVDRMTAWSPQLHLECPVPDFVRLRTLSTEIRESLTRAATRKAAAPLEALDVKLVDDARVAALEVGTMLSSYNDAVIAANKSITGFKQGLAAENVAALERDLATARLSKTRHLDEVVAIIKERNDADGERTRCETAKAKARAELDALMSNLLARYRTDINRWLAQFGAPFSISTLNFTYQGGTTPRTEYAIDLRGKAVTAGRKSANSPSFHTALSDGDKRTLALAFFLARVLGDADAAAAIVVLDDVFASMDRDRRAQTMGAISKLAQSCAQVLVLGHDAYFLRDLSRQLCEKKIAEPLVLQIRRVADGFSQLDDCDLTELCASAYYKRYREVSEYLAGAATPNLLPVAQALRPLVEGCLHRRFPGLIKEGLTFGVILDQIKNATPGSPLIQLQSQLGPLGSFNDFVGSFHHDTAGIAVRHEVTDGELLAFARQAMTFAQTGAM